jgi:hypothetical protein
LVRVEVVMKKIYYEKVGRRYVPVGEYDSDLMSSLPHGAHLVMCYPGGASRRYNIDPALAPMIAAGRYAEEAVSQALIKASEMRPKRTPMTDQQRIAWENLISVWGEEARYLEWASAREVAEAGVRAMMEEADKMLEHPAVRRAYDRFMLIAELVNSKNKEQNV